MRHVTLGIEKLLADPPEVTRGCRVGLVTNPSGIDHHLRSSATLLARHPGITLRALYGPEHGVRGQAQAGEHVGGGIDPVTGLPVHSLYGETREPTAEMLEGIDTLVVDLQDIGVRYATYLSTVAHVLSACAMHGKRVVIADRPNPLGGSRVAGNLLDPAFASFVGIHRIPIIHGLTIGEFGRLWARDHGLPSPEVVMLEGWSRATWFDETDVPWVLPSPNLPTLDSVTLYPATCLVEGTVLSEGRGTTRPFELVGAPWIDPDALADAMTSRDLDGVGFRPAWFTPTFSKYQGVACGGVQVHILDRDAIDPLALGVDLLATIRRLWPDHFAWLSPSGDRHFIDLLAGGPDLRELIDSGHSPTTLLNRWADEAATFARDCSDILLY